MPTAPAPQNQTTLRLGLMVSGAVPTGTDPLMEVLSVATFDASAGTTRAATANRNYRGLVGNNAAMSRSGSGTCNRDRSTFGARTFEKAVGGPFTADALQSSTGINAVATGNKLTLGSGTWPVGIVAGSFVLVKGFADGAGKNGSLWIGRVLSAPSGVNLPLDPVWKTLVDETSSGTVKVWHDGHQVYSRLVNDTYFAEWFNPTSSVGNLATGIMVTGLTTSFDPDSYVKDTFTFRCSDRIELADALTLTNSTPAHTDGPEWSSGPGFGAADFPEYGLGLRYNGELVDADVTLHGLKQMLENPAKGSRAYNRLEDVGQFRDDASTASLEITIKRDGNAVSETVYADSRLANTVCSWSFGYLDAAGNVTYYHFAECQPSQEKPDQVGPSGEAEFTVTYMIRDNALYSYRSLSTFTPR